MQSQAVNNSHILSIAVTVLMISIFSTSALADITHADDVIVDGSICVDSGGTDCADGENFGVGGPNTAQFKAKADNPIIFLEDINPNSPDWAIVVDGFPGPGIPANGSLSIFNDNTDTTPFLIEDGTGDNLLYLDSEDKIGINTNAPGEDLEIEGSNPVIRLDDNSASGLQMDIGVRTDRLEIEGNTQQDIVEIHAEAPALSFTIDSAGSTRFGGTFSVASSRSIKRDIHALNPLEARAAVQHLSPVQFRFKHEDQKQLGFIAEDLPELIMAKDGKSLRPMDVVTLLTSVVQQHDEMIVPMSTWRPEIEERLHIMTLERNRKIEDLAGENKASKDELIRLREVVDRLVTKDQLATAN